MIIVFHYAPYPARFKITGHDVALAPFVLAVLHGLSAE